MNLSTKNWRLKKNSKLLLSKQSHSQTQCLTFTNSSVKKAAARWIGFQQAVAVLKTRMEAARIHHSLTQLTVFSCSIQIKKRLAFASRFFGSGRRIRTLTNRVRVCRATLTQSRCIAPVIAGAGFIIPKQFHLSSFFAKLFAGFFLDKGPAFFYNMEQYQQKRGREQDLCVPLREPVVGANRRGDSRCILAPELSA